MAMLAEPRRRKRYNLVPRGKALYEDDSRFGTKMLEKMGWTKGKGLGANESGSKDFVRVRYKNDANGFGYEERDDQWTQHEQSFNGLLQSLNGSEESGDDKKTTPDDKNQVDTDEVDMSTVGFGFQQNEPKKTNHKLKEKISGESLEEKSKKSKARVHYKKFTRGKDLAQYSEKDLANIFGKKVVEENINGLYEQLTAISMPQNKEMKKQNDIIEETSNFGGVQTISSGVSVSDYFKQKMEAMKQKKNQQTISNCHEDNVQDEMPKKRKRKEKRVQEAMEPAENFEKAIGKDNVSDAQEEIGETFLNNVHDTLAENPKKNKKRKKLEIDSVQVALDDGVEKKVKKSELAANETEADVKSKKERKSKKKEKQIDESMSELSLPIEEEHKFNITTKASKKSKKRKSEEIIAATEASSELASSTPNEKSHKEIEEVSDEASTTLRALENFNLKYNSYNLYKISSFCAEKFRLADIDRFAGANLKQIVGYGLSDELKLDIRVLKSDEKRINQLWNCVLNKYDNAAPKNPYSKFTNKVHKARRNKQKLPRLCIKSLKRKHAFIGI